GAVHVGEPEIEDHQVGRLQRSAAQGFGSVLGFLDRKAVELQTRAQEAADLHLVIHDQGKGLGFTHPDLPPAGSSGLQTADVWPPWSLDRYPRSRPRSFRHWR